MIPFCMSETSRRGMFTSWHTSVPAPACYGCEFIWLSRQNLDSIEVALQRSNEWLSKHSLHLGSVQGSCSFPSSSEGMHKWVKIP
jgi:hypothetical protein